MEFIEITHKMNQLYERKNKDYGNSFEKTLDEFGPVAGIVRLNDKMNRIKSIYKAQSTQVNESMEDTLLDLANYAVMTLQWLTNQQ
jgi:hypothetical protein